MTPLSGTVLLTGANGGIAIGFVTQFLKSAYAVEYKGVYGVRDPAKANDLQTTLKDAASNHDYEITTMDLSSLETTRKAAAAINSRVADGSIPPIRALILNAGVQDVHAQEFTPDGIERIFAVNYLHNFLLVLLLLQSMDKTHGRIIVIGSTAIDPNWGLNGDAYKEESQKVMFTSVDELAKGETAIKAHQDSGLRRYAKSKVAMLMLMYELQRRLNSDSMLSKVSMLGLDPGWVTSSIVRNAGLSVRMFVGSFRFLALPISVFWPNHFIRTAAKTGDDLVRVCFDTEKFGEYPKALYINGSELGDTTDQAKDERKQKTLWEGSLKWAKVHEGDTVLVNWK